MIRHLHAEARPVILRSLLRDNESFSAYLKDTVGVPASVALSLTNAKVYLNPVSTNNTGINETHNVKVLPKLTSVLQVMGVPRSDNLRRILCEGTGLDGYVQFSSPAEKEAFQNVSCSLTPQQLINTQQILLQNLDMRKVLSEVSCSEAYGILCHSQ